MQLSKKDVSLLPVRYLLKVQHNHVAFVMIIFCCVGSTGFTLPDNNTFNVEWRFPYVLLHNVIFEVRDI